MLQLLIPIFCLVLFPFHLECWSFSSLLDPTCFSVRLTPGIEQQQTLPVSHSSMRFSQAFSFTPTKVVRDQPLLLSLCQRKSQTQRGSVSYPAWVLCPVVDRAGPSNATTPGHNHNSLPMVRNRKQFCPALEIVGYHNWGGPGIKGSEVRDAVRHPTVQGADPPKNYTAQDVNGAKWRNPALCVFC